jgi:hypothetical protein
VGDDIGLYGIVGCMAAAEGVMAPPRAPTASAPASIPGAAIGSVIVFPARRNTFEAKLPGLSSPASSSVPASRSPY